LCHICNHKALNPDHLKRHIKVVHKGTKQYRCKICGTFYSKSTNLTEHIGLKHLNYKDSKTWRLPENRDVRHAAVRHDAFQFIPSGEDEIPRDDFNGVQDQIPSSRDTPVFHVEEEEPQQVSEASDRNQILPKVVTSLAVSRPAKPLSTHAPAERETMILKTRIYERNYERIHTEDKQLILPQVNRSMPDMPSIEVQEEPRKVSHASSAYPTVSRKAGTISSKNTKAKRKRFK